MNLACQLVRFRFAIAIAWVLLVAAFVPLANRLEKSLSMATAGPSGDSTSVTRILKERFQSPFAERALLVISGTPDVRTPEGEGILRSISSSIAAIGGVTAVASYLDSHDRFLISNDGTSAVLVAGIDTAVRSPDAEVRALRQATAKLVAELTPRANGIRMSWTGDAAVNYDIRAAGSEQARNAELRAMPLTVAVLIGVFSSIAAAILPVAAGAMAIPLAMGGAMLLTNVWPMSSLLVNVVTMIGLALSIDYSLLIVERFREARAHGLPVKRAAMEASAQAGRTVLTSGLAVAIGFGALLAIPVDELRSVAAGGLLATLSAVLLATTLIPGVLSTIGGVMDWGRLRTARPLSMASVRMRWAKFVTRRPFAVLLVAGIPVIALASQAQRLSLELPRGDWFPPKVESTLAMKDLKAMGRSNMVDTIRLVIETPPGTGIGGSVGWNAVDRLTKTLEADARVERVTSLASLMQGSPFTPAAMDKLPKQISENFISADRQLALIEIVPAKELESYQVTHFVRFLRSVDAEALTGLANARIRIGGQPAFQAEYEDAVTASFASVVALVLAGTIVALVVAFRSALIPVKALALNLLSVAAGFGAMVLAFQDGYGGALLGLAGPAGGVFPIIPPLVFCAVFGISMDYEVFMVARIAEVRAHAKTENEAIADGLARVSGLISGAATVMIAVFAAFSWGDFLMMKMLGFALAVTVLIDVTIVRMAIGPALFTLAGRWNWWPGENYAKRASASFNKKSVTLRQGTA